MPLPPMRPGASKGKPPYSGKPKDTKAGKPPMKSDKKPKKKG